MRFGFLTGLRAEADMAQRLSPLVRFTASKPDRAFDLAWQLIREGATVLVSFGIAGGLAPTLTPGTLIVADEVQGEKLGKANTDRSLFLRLQALTPSIACGSVFGSDAIVATSAAKQALHEKTGALAVDMESHIVAAVAQDAGIPFAVLRAIADPAQRSLPPAAFTPLKEDGTPDTGRILKTALRHPEQWPGLGRVGFDYFLALTALRRLTYIRFLPEAE